MAFLTKSAFGKLAGVSRQRISKMCQLGHLTVRPDGKLDTEDRTNKNYLSKQERPDGLKSADQKQKKVQKKREIPPNNTNPKDNQEIPIEAAETILDGIPDDLQTMSKYDLDRMKAAVTILKERLKHDKEREELLDSSIVKKTFHALYQIDTEEFLQSSAAIAPRLCQDVFGTNEPEKMTKVSEILDTEFYKIQNHIRITLNRELENMRLEIVGS